MPEQCFTVLDTRRFLHASAMMTSARFLDRFLFHGVWGDVKGCWKRGGAVDEVRHHGTGLTRVQQVFSVYSFSQVLVANVQVLTIQMQSLNTLTDLHLAAMGYRSRAAFEHEWGRLPCRDIWYVSFLHLTASDVELRANLN